MISEERRGALTLVFLVVLTQAIALAFQAIIKPLYSIEDFGIFEIYFRLANFLGFLITFRYEYALYKNISHPHFSHSVIGLFFYCALSFLIILTLTLIALKVAEIFDLAVLVEAEVFVFACISALFIATFRILVIVASLRGKYLRLGMARVAKRASEGGAQTLLASYFGGLGLLLGEILGNLIFFIVSRDRDKSNDLRFRTIATRSVRQRGFKAFKSLREVSSDFPRKKLPADLLDLFTDSIPVIVMAMHFELLVIGFYELTSKILVAPAALFATSLSPLIFRFAAKLDTTRSEFALALLKLFVLFLVIAMLFSVCVVFGGEFIIVELFGETWRPVAAYMLILLPGLMAQFVVSPFGEVLTLVDQVRVDFYWKMFRCLAISSLFLFDFDAAKDLLLHYSALTVFVFIVYLAVIVVVVGKHRKENRS